MLDLRMPHMILGALQNKPISFPGQATRHKRLCPG